MLPLAAWAFAYADQGWPVFPLLPGNKTPMTRTGFKEATTDHDQLAAWWRREPTANIGIATGEAFDVLDVDGDAGARFLRDWLATRGITYRHEGPVGITGKGWHFLFAPTGRRNGANLGGDGEKGPDGKLLRPTKIDFRGAGGYIVAPPSLHPLGHHYAWDEVRGPETDLPDAPAWLTELLDDTGIGTPTPVKTTRKAILDNKAYALLVEAGAAIAKDQFPRAVQTTLNRPDILAVCAERGIAVRMTGRYGKAKCPFHNEDTPSFTVYPENDTFYCYGCDAHGDSIDLQKGEHL